MIIDEPQTNSQIRQFAGQTEHIETHTLIDFENSWNGDQADEFYRGLLAGLSVAGALNQQGMNETVHQLVAFVALQMEKKEIHNPEG
jgi:hypothetical protein